MDERDDEQHGGGHPVLERVRRTRGEGGEREHGRDHREDSAHAESANVPAPDRRTAGVSAAERERDPRRDPEDEAAERRPDDARGGEPDVTPREDELDRGHDDRGGDPAAEDRPEATHVPVRPDPRFETVRRSHERRDDDHEDRDGHDPLALPREEHEGGRHRRSRERPREDAADGALDQAGGDRSGHASM
jgi:hypothetical protein